MQTAPTMIAGRHWTMPVAVRVAMIVGCALLVCACKTDQVAGVPDASPDYRLRHPITIKEAERSFEIFIGSNRGSLNPDQRAQLLAFAQGWRRDATGGTIIDLPVGTSDEHAAADALPEIRSILAASGVPPQSMVVRGYHPPDSTLAPVRVTYPRMTAEAGPCGIWPKDIGPSFNRDYFENQPPWNYGCAMQRNLASMVDNPTDLVQPRAESPSYTMRRTTVVEKYRLGASTATTYPSSDSSKISDVGK